MSRCEKIARATYRGACACGISISILLSSYGHALNLDRAASQLSVQHWDTDDGLPAEAIWALHVSTAGYLWIGTESGLVRFDGARFSQFDASRYSEIVSDEIRSITEGPDNTIWAATIGGGVLRVRGDTVKRFDESDGLNSNVVYSVKVARNGDLWFGTASGVCRMSSETVKCWSALDGLADGSVLFIAEGQDGRMWFGGISHGLSSFDGTSFSTHKVPTSEGSEGKHLPVVLMTEDPEHNVVLGTYQKEYFRIDSGRILPLDHKDIPAILLPISALRDGDHNLFIGAQHNKGVWQIEPKVQRIDVDSGQRSYVFDLQEDAYGNIWAGTSEGLYRYRAGAFVPWGEPEYLTNSTFVVAASIERGVWVGTEGKGLFHISQDGKVEQLNVALGLPSNNVSSLLQLDDGTLWAGTFGAGIAVIRGRSVTRVIDSDLGLKSDQILSMFEDRDGAIWLGTAGGLHRWYEGVISHTFQMQDGLVGDAVRHIAQDRNGVILLSGDNGLVRLSPDSFQIDSVFDDLAVGVNDTATYTLVDDRGVVWIGARSGGLVRLEEGEIFRYLPEHSLGIGSVMAIVDDGLGNLWLAGRQGIVSISRAELDSVAAGESQRVYPRLFSENDGLRTTRVPGGFQSAVTQTDDGRLWFATGRGVVSISTLDLPDVISPPKVTIESVTVDGEQISGGSTYNIPAGFKSLQIDYTVPKLDDAQALRFHYRLNAENNEWQHVGERRTAFFSSLKPRRNRFEVGATLAGQPLVPDGASVTGLELYVEPLWFQTYAARTGFAATLILFFLCCYWLALTRYRNRQRQLEVIVDERTAALKNALAEVEVLSRTDALTGVFNRRHFEEQLAAGWSRAVKMQQQIGLIMIDIDHFKQFNDTAGHQEGDRCLQIVAQSLSSHLREDDFIARYGGEEFVVMLIGKDADAMLQIGERLQKGVRGLGIPHPGLAAGKVVTVSAGFSSTLPAAGDQPAPLLRQSDDALYRAKADGRDRIVAL